MGSLPLLNGAPIPTLPMGYAEPHLPPWSHRVTRACPSHYPHTENTSSCCPDPLEPARCCGCGKGQEDVDTYTPSTNSW